MYLLLVMNAFLGLLFTLDKEILNYLPPMTFLAARTIACGLIFFFMYWFSGEYSGARVTWGDLGRKIVLSFFNIYLMNYFFFKALETLSAAKAALLYNSQPFIVTIFAYIFLRDAIGWRKALGLLIGWIGFIPILFYDNPSPEGLFVFSSGELYALGAALSVAMSYIIFHKIMTKRDASVTLTSAMNLFSGGLFGLIHAFTAEANVITQLPALSAPWYVAFLFIGVIVVTLGWSLSFTYLTSQYPSSFLAATGLVSSLFAAIFQWILLGDSVSYTFYITLACVAAGLWYMYKAEQKKIARMQT